MVNPATTLDDAAKCALISMDSTLRSNVSVGLPLDMLVYENDRLAVTRFVTIDEHNQYFRMLRSSWGNQLKAVFEGIDAQVWDAAPDATENVLSAANRNSKPVRVSLPPGLTPTQPSPPLQSVAEHPPGKQH